MQERKCKYCNAAENIEIVFFLPFFCKIQEYGEILRMSVKKEGVSFSVNKDDFFVRKRRNYRVIFFTHLYFL